ncbi:MAG: Maf family protein [Trueperaceae bacterium]
MTNAAVVLASSSPRRRDLLTALGVRFETRPADVDETPRPGEAPEALASRLATAKAEAVARERPHALVLAADTVVVLDGRALGKPRNEDENRRFLRRLAGVPHHVVTAHHLVLAGASAHRSVVTDVRLRTLHDQEIERYVARGAGLDKAGGYAIQDHGAALVGDVHGCYSNVIGLSLPAVHDAAAQLGVRLV